MSSVFDQLLQATVFTKLDLHNAYHLIRIREGDEWKTGFNPLMHDICTPLLMHNMDQK